MTAGDFDAIDLPRGADEASEKTERDGVISQSFLAQQTSPEQIMDSARARWNPTAGRSSSR